MPQASSTLEFWKSVSKGKTWVGLDTTVSCTWGGVPNHYTTCDSQHSQASSGLEEQKPTTHIKKKYIKMF